MKTTIVQADHKRLEKALAFSVLLWTLIFLGFSRIVLRGPEVPKDSMNPLYVELAPNPPTVAEKKIEVPPTSIGGASATSQGLGSPSTGTTLGTSVPQGSSGATRAASSGVSGSPGAAGPSATYTLHPDPGSAPLPSQGSSSLVEGTSSRYSSGTDQWAPLSEQSLTAQTPSAPASPNSALESRGGQRTAQTTRPAGVSADSFDQAWSQTSQKLGSGSSSAASSSQTGSPTPHAGGSSSAGSSYSGGGAGGASDTGGTQGAGGDVGGSIDFGSGSPRELWSPRRIRIPDALMRGKPQVIETVVSFTVERGGTVLAPTIKFNPPLPNDLDAYLRTAFASWLFSPADSDGQARFSYSIKVR